MTEALLLSNKHRKAGYLLLLPAFLIFIFQQILQFKLDFLYVKVFAIQSKFFDTKYFTWIHSNISDEIFAISLILGLSIIAITKEKQEIEENCKLRITAITIAFIVNGLFMILGLVFFYGFAAVNILIVNLFSFIFLYIVTFRFLLYRNSKSLSAGDTD